MSPLTLALRCQAMSKKLESQIQSVPAKMSPYQIRWQEILIATNGLTSHRSLQPLGPAENGEFLLAEVSNFTLQSQRLEMLQHVLCLAK